MHLCRETSREVVLELGDQCLSVQKRVEHEPKVSERVDLVKADKLARFAQIDAHEYDHRKWKGNHHDFLKALNQAPNPNKTGYGSLR